MTKQIPLSRGKFAIVDDDVYEWASQHKWYAHHSRKSFYVCRKGGLWPFRKAVYLHREIMQAPDGTMVDHLNGDGLDCTRANMRLASNAENGRNRPRSANNKSGFKGVSWKKNRAKWQAQIRLNGKNIPLGLFTNPEAAARAYDAAARKYHGEFAKTNF